MMSPMARLIFCLSLALPLVSCNSGGSDEPAASPPASIATASAQFEWDPNTETDLACYKVYKGTSSGQYGASIATLPASSTSYEADGLQKGSTYFFVVTAYDTSGNEGPLSDELSIPIPSPSRRSTHATGKGNGAWNRIPHAPAYRPAEENRNVPLIPAKFAEAAALQ